MANRTANRKARRLLGMRYKLSNKPNNTVFPQHVFDFVRSLLPESLKTQDIVAIRSILRTISGMTFERYGFYNINVFYPAYIGHLLENQRYGLWLSKTRSELRP